MEKRRRGRKIGPNSARILLWLSLLGSTGDGSWRSSAQSNPQVAGGLHACAAPWAIFRRSGDLVLARGGHVSPPHTRWARHRFPAALLQSWTPLDVLPSNQHKITASSAQLTALSSGRWGVSLSA